jgi:hypothetical protein
VARELPDAVRREVLLRAQSRCEYCLYPEARSAFVHQVDHIVSLKHGGKSTLDNLALCCIFCNRYKGSDVASIHIRTGVTVRLFHPRLDQWSDHFRISGGIIEPLTMDQAQRVVERGLLQAVGLYPRA